MNDLSPIQSCPSYLGSNVGIQETSVKAAISLELILASSVMPPDRDSGPTESTRQRMSSLQKTSSLHLSTHPFATPSPPLSLSIRLW